MHVMEWVLRNKQFWIRFVISLVILTGLYLLLFGLPAKSHNTTPNQKVAILRAKLNQVQITGDNLAAFNQADAVAGERLSQLGSQFEKDIGELDNASGGAANLIDNSTKNKLQTVMDQQQQASKEFLAAYSVLNKVIAYDPAIDLGRLSIGAEAATLRQRAAAAGQGLSRIAQNGRSTQGSSDLGVQAADGSGLVVNADIKGSILNSSSCFDRLARQLDQQKYNDAGRTRTDCIKAYPRLRQKAIQHVISTAFDQKYQAYMTETVRPLLRQLDEQL